MISSLKSLTTIAVTATGVTITGPAWVALAVVAAVVYIVSDD